MALESLRGSEFINNRFQYELCSFRLESLFKKMRRHHGVKVRRSIYGTLHGSENIDATLSATYFGFVKILKDKGKGTFGESKRCITIKNHFEMIPCKKHFLKFHVVICGCLPLFCRLLWIKVRHRFSVILTIFG